MTDDLPQIMIDLEAWSTRTNALIVSIGACRFDLHGTGSTDRFEVAIHPESGRGLNRHMDPGTILWWMAPEREEPRTRWLRQPKVDLPDALYGLTDWVRSVTGPSMACRVWGNGAAFDNVLLRDSFEACGIEPFWAFRDDRCYRTMKALAPEVQMVRQGLHHDALADAVDQALHLQAIMRSLKGVA